MDVSVVCPFYNEEALIESAVRKMLDTLETLSESWELIIVNDGSTDDSLALVKHLAGTNPHLRVLSYAINRGRGYALRTGIAAARGDIIVTTEADLSWGENIVHDLLAEMHKWPDADMVVASPHLPGGGYENVPGNRVFLSQFGNWVIRACMSDAVTMNTGMTRAYRREAIQSLPLYENRKEFHLEVILKATALGQTIRETPAVLRWPPERRTTSKKRGILSSSIKRFIVSHSLFSLFGNPIRYIWGLSFLSFGLSLLFLVSAVVLYVLSMVSAYMALMSVSLFILGIVLFLFGIVVKQGSMVQRELWIMQRHNLLQHPSALPSHVQEFSFSTALEEDDLSMTVEDDAF